jgi:hypothetical protein
VTAPQKRPYVPVPREECPDRCQGHFAPCEHSDTFMACLDCIADRRRTGPIFCAAPDENGPYREDQNP